MILRRLGIFETPCLRWKLMIRSDIARRTDEQWEALPAHFRLEGNLNECTTNPFERDFLLSTRLNHLQVKFLLRFVLLDSLAQPDEMIVTIAQQMLSLVVEGILLREYLANSGTGLIWKVLSLHRPNHQRSPLTMNR
jgi:hypothetical protein